MEKAVNTLKTLLKVKPLQEAYALTDANFGELGIEKWNTELFGDEANKKENNDLKSLGIDLVIFGKFEDLVDTTLATANSMAYQRTEVNKGQPYIGVVRINKNIDFSKPNTKEFFQTVLVHEFTHILGFSKNFFETYYNNIFTKVDSDGLTRRYLNSPKLLEVARKYFNCPTLEGVELENQGGEGTEDSHWEARILLGEYMIGYSYSEEQVISEFTLAVLEDSGYYKPNYYTGGLMRFGKHKGCEFLEQKCINPQTHKVNEKFENEFFDTLSLVSDIDAGCSSGRQSRTYKFFYLISNLPNAYRYFENPEMAVYLPADYCPVSLIIPEEENLAHYSGHCSQKGQGYYGSQLNYNAINFDAKSETLIGLTGEQFTDHSFCFLSSLYKNIISFTKIHEIVRANCYEVFCSQRSLTLKIFEDYIVCPRAGGKIKVGGYEGYLLCPDYNLLCSGTVLCNDIFDCVEKRSEIKDKDYIYDYEIQTSQNIAGSKNVAYATDNYELSEDGKCPQNCKICKEDNICLECRDDYGLLLEESGEIKCYSNSFLSKGYFKNEETNMFEKCLDNCISCTNKESCDECSSVYMYIEHRCQIPSSADKIVANCLEYDTNENCIKCKSNYAFKGTNKGQCLSIKTDLANYYTKDGISYYPCSEANPECSTCYFDQNTKNITCTLCINEFVLLNKLGGICISKEEIDDRYYLINDTHIGDCTENIENCAVCVNATVCSECKEGWYLIRGNNNGNGKDECSNYFELGMDDESSDSRESPVDNSIYFSFVYIFGLHFILSLFYFY